MRDPFAFMGNNRGADRPAEPPAMPRSGQRRFLVPDDPDLAKGCFELLEALNHPTVPLASPDEVPVIACRLGFECDSVRPGLWELRHDGAELVGFLKNPVGARPGIRGRPRMPFELFVVTDGIVIA